MTNKSIISSVESDLERKGGQEERKRDLDIFKFAILKFA